MSYESLVLEEVWNWWIYFSKSPQDAD